MPQSEAQRKAQRAYIASGKRAQVVITMRAEEKNVWDEYAKKRNIPLATLIRQLIRSDMAQHDISISDDEIVRE